ncbi:nickel transporter [Streptomyces sp. MST-110588]|nr:nickel transporter [Streptomyces sp. MST-110588]
MPEVRRRRWARRVVLLVGVFLPVVLLGTTGAAPAAAHPLGNFTVNAYDGLTVSPRELRVDHVEDLAEIPAAQAEPRIDQDGDHRLDAAERIAWARRMCVRAARGSALTVDGRPVRPASRGERARAVRRPGQAGLSTLRLECLLTAPLGLSPGMDDDTDNTADTDSTADAADAADSGTAVRFTGGMAVGEDGPGWRETTARGDRVRLVRTDVPARSASARLTRYPDDLLSTPLRQHGAHLAVRAGGPALTADANGGPSGGLSDGASDAAGEQARPGAVAALPRGADGLTQRFTGLVGSHRLTLGFGLLALALAAVLGAAHALAPGHGKTVMAAYAAGGHRGSFRSLLRIGAAVTVTHTAGVLVLGVVVAAGPQAVPLAIPWLTALSGLLVAAAGTALLRRALAHRSGPVHVHTHLPSHDHGHAHQGEHEPGRAHAHATAVAARPRTRDTLLLGFAGGLVPSPSAVLVLVGSSALGRLWFGALLVLAYGVGLAFTLVVVAVLLVRVGARLGQRLMGAAPRYERVFGFLHRTAPAITASLVVLLGAALALRGVVAAG